ncbi:MAG: DNA gyrase inhibitor YacG [Planctomycetota bacterium]
MKSRCPICGKVIETAAEEPGEIRLLPFCSKRCKLIDLGTWLDAEYRILSALDPPNPDHLPSNLPDNSAREQ